MLTYQSKNITLPIIIPMNAPPAPKRRKSTPAPTNPPQKPNQPTNPEDKPKDTPKPADPKSDPKRVA